MTEQERKKYHDEFGYDPEYYMEQNMDIRHHLKFINQDPVQRVLECVEKLKSEKQDS